MIVTPEEVKAFAATVRLFERDSAWSRAIASAIQQTTDPATVARTVLSQLTPKQLKLPPDSTADLRMLHYLRDRPQLLIPCGFDEIRIEPQPARELAKAMYEEGSRRGSIPSGFQTERLPHHEAFEIMLGLHCRDAMSGAWYRRPFIEPATGRLRLRGATLDSDRIFTFAEMVEACSRATRGDECPAVIMLPNLWRPPASMPSIALAEATRDLVIALQRHNVLLQDLTGYQLEDVIAEILGQKGFQIQVTPRSKDGGRDIIARGELVPGESCIVAVEVKHRAVVKVADIRNHLQANTQFPMLLVATSGRFTAGAVREKMKPENFLRLHLRDHEAVSAWIAEYRS